MRVIPQRSHKVRYKRYFMTKRKFYEVSTTRVLYLPAFSLLHLAVRIETIFF
jgi:hypothetical protein